MKPSHSLCRNTPMPAILVVPSIAKYPKPAIARCGAFSLKKNGENSGARNGCVVVGFQKLTSSHERCWLK